MREKTAKLASRLKYVLMQFLFASVHRVICSSTTEVDYYRAVFKWSNKKVQYVPILTRSYFELKSDLVEDTGGDKRPYMLAAGRALRDFETAVTAVAETPFRLVIVGGAGVTDRWRANRNVQVYENVSLERLTALMAACTAVLVPLEDRKISTGQSVVLHAMALGKPVIATRTAGTIDYIENNSTGILVAPYNVTELRAAIMAMSDRNTCESLGKAGQKVVNGRCLPWHYAKNIRAVLAD
jgi:glycosyltransferase involved in cell wall biosynthesis